VAELKLEASEMPWRNFFNFTPAGIGDAGPQNSDIHRLALPAADVGRRDKKKEFLLFLRSKPECY
jgi:hypothetical protein